MLKSTSEVCSTVSKLTCSLFFTVSLPGPIVLMQSKNSLFKNLRCLYVFLLYKQQFVFSSWLERSWIEYSFCPLPPPVKRGCSQPSPPPQGHKSTDKVTPRVAVRHVTVTVFGEGNSNASCQWRPSISQRKAENVMEFRRCLRPSPSTFSWWIVVTNLYTRLPLL